MKRFLALSLLLCAIGAMAQPMRFAGFMGEETAATWYPTNVAGLVRWFDAQQSTSFNGGDGISGGDSITNWTDLTGTTNLTQTAAAAQPKYVSSDAVLGNKPCVYFDTTSIQLTNKFTADQTVTLFMVAYVTNTATQQVLDEDYSSNCGLRTQTNAWKYVPQYTAADPANAAGVVIVKHVDLDNTFIRTQSGSWLLVDADNDYDDGGIFRINGASMFVGEVLLYGSALSDADVNTVGSNLATQWNFTWTDL